MQINILWISRRLGYSNTTLFACSKCKAPSQHWQYLVPYPSFVVNSEQQSISLCVSTPLTGGDVGDENAPRTAKLPSATLPRLCCFHWKRRRTTPRFEVSYSMVTMFGLSASNVFGGFLYSTTALLEPGRSIVWAVVMLIPALDANNRSAAKATNLDRLGWLS